MMKTIRLATALTLVLVGSAFAQTGPPAPTYPAPTYPVPANAGSTTGTAVLNDAVGNTTTVTSHHPVPPPRDHRAEFDRIDTDRDGNVSRGEAGVDKYLARAFPMLDGDRSGRLNFGEMQPWLDD